MTAKRTKRPPALSISRLKEYRNCPLKFRLHMVDGFRDPASEATARGTLVHSVLERLFDLPSAERTPEAAVALLPREWEAQRAKDPSVDVLVNGEEATATMMARAEESIRGYFGLEQPQYIEPAGREEFVSVISRTGLRLHGFIDRVDRTPAGDERVIDYKTGKFPKERYWDEYFDQMRFYSLMLRDLRGLPRRTQLLFVNAGQALTLDPDPADIDRFEEQVDREWRQVESDLDRGEFSPRKNPLCNWCGVRDMCPVFGNTTPEPPEGGYERLKQVRVS